jgi:hypothetical protein
VTDSPASTLAAFGLALLTEGPLPGAWETQPPREPQLRIQSVPMRAIAQSWSGFQSIGWEGVIDGAPFVVERGLAGDHRFVHGTPPDERGVPSDATRAIHHLCADSRLLQCAPADAAEPSWWRVVLDSVLFSVALLQGYEALHAGAVATPAGVIAITAATGGGKSTMLAELLRRGMTLMADDVLMLESRGADAPLAHPAPPLMNIPTAAIPMLEERGPVNRICALDDEQWIAVPVCSEALPLKALAPLLSSLMNFPRSSARQRARFELASVLSCTTSLWRLTGDLDATPSALADALLAGGL